MKKKNLLMILTGGTFGMSEGHPELKPSKLDGDSILKLVPELSLLAKISWVKVFNLDSSDISHLHWINIGKTIEDKYDDFDGFIIIHGTDTMVYSATALSFMMKHTSKPIIFTGSQRPLSLCRNDARTNLIDAVEYALRQIPEVCICFNSILIRGNRARKKSIGDYNAFDSPNYSILANSGVEIIINNSALREAKNPTWNFNFDTNVGLIKLFPSLNSSIFNFLLYDTSIKALVIEGFGAGNIPEIKKTWLELISKLKDLGKLVVITSQCSHGAVNLNLYENGKKAHGAGAISCNDISTEACIVKLMFFLSKDLSYDEIKLNMQKPYCGEMSNQSSS